MEVMPTLVSAGPPSDCTMNPPTKAPAMPIRMVTMMPPGSGPGMIHLASTPAIRPTTINAKLPMGLHPPPGAATPPAAAGAGPRHAPLRPPARYKPHHYHRQDAYAHSPPPRVSYPRGRILAVNIQQVPRLGLRQAP